MLTVCLYKYTNQVEGITIPTEMLAARAPQAKNVDFFFDIFRLEKGIFHPNIGVKKRFGIGNITV